MAHLVSETKLVNSCCRVTTTDNGSCIGLSQSLCYSDGTCCQGRILEYAHRSVPYNGLSGLYSLSIQSCGLGSDIASLSVCGHVGNIIYLNLNRSIDRVGEISDGYGINRQ